MNLNKMSSPYAPVECKIGQQIASSPRKCAIGKPSLRLSIPNVQHHGSDAAKNQKRFASNNIKNYIQNQKNQNHNGGSGGSFVKRMVENCNNQGQFGSNEKIKCDNEREPSKSDIKIIVNNSNCENKSALDSEPTEDSTTITTVTDGNIGNNDAYDVNSSTNHNTNNPKSNILQLPSYSAFESDFRKEIDDMNTSSRLDLHMKGLFKYFFLLHFTFQHETKSLLNSTNNKKKQTI